MKVRAIYSEKTLLYVSVGIFLFALLNWIQSITKNLPEMWFYVDEWWVIRRVTSGSMEYLVPFNEHLSLIPLLIYKFLATIFTMDNYTPYFIAMLLPLLMSCLIFGIVLRRKFKVPLWVIILVSALYLVNGAGAPSLVWAFQVGVTLQALYFSLVIAIYLMSTGENIFLKRVKLPVISIILLLSALTSGAYPFVLLTFVLISFSRLSPKVLFFVVAPSLVLFSAWYLTFGVKYRGPKYGILDNPGLILEFPKFFLGMVLFSVNSFSPSTYLNVLYLLLFVLGLFSQNKDVRQIFITCISVLIFFSFITTWNRVSLGFPLTGSGHYQYIQSAFLFIPVCLSLGMLFKTRFFPIRVNQFISVLTCFVLVLNIYISDIKYSSIINWRSQVDSSIKNDFSKACQGIITAAEIGRNASKFGFNIYPGQIDQQLIISLRGNRLFSSSCNSNE